MRQTVSVAGAADDAELDELELVLLEPLELQPVIASARLSS